MKGLSRFVLVIGIAAGWLVLTVDSLMAKDTLYQKYEYNAAEAPVMSLSLRSIFHREVPYFVALANGDYARFEQEQLEQKAAEEQAQKKTEEQAKAENSSNDAADANSNGSDGSGSIDEATGSDENVNGENATDGNKAGAEPAENTTSQDETVEEPVEETYVLTEVPDDYFADALFIGDSRTVGLSEYCEPLMELAQFYAKISLTIYDFDKKEFVEVPIVQDDERDAAQEANEEETVEASSDEPKEQGEAVDASGNDSDEQGEADASGGDSNDSQNLEDVPTEKVTIEEALSRQEFGKVYIMLGLNELGSGTVETFCKSYGEVVNRIRELQPDATIYIQGIMHVTSEKSDHDKIFKNSIINERNEGLKGLADNQHVFYIDMNEATDDENGNLASELSFDNIHLKAKSYALWYDYLKTHAYVKESEYADIIKRLEEIKAEQNVVEELP